MSASQNGICAELVHIEYKEWLCGEDRGRVIIPQDKNDALCHLAKEESFASWSLILRPAVSKHLIMHNGNCTPVSF